MARDYYAQKLSGRRLQRVYAIADPRVRRYLQAEIDHLAAYIRPGMRILELGCGYGRVLGPLAAVAGAGWGVDNALDSLVLARELFPQLRLAAMDAGHLAIGGAGFDLVFGVQNFISACKVPPEGLIREGLRVLRPGGRLLLSSYAPRFWRHRLNWFRRQAREGLVGPIDEHATGNGVIVCSDGFRASTVSAEEFSTLAAAMGVMARIDTVDQSSLFCELEIPQ